MKFLTIVFLAAVLGSLSAAARTTAPDELFFHANELAANEAWDEAIAAYLQILEVRSSPNIHYNLGTAYYHARDLGRARIHWERTLAMDPRHPGARHNLHLLFRRTGIEEPSGGAAARFAGLLSAGQWIWLAAVGFWSGAFCLVGIVWKRRPGLYVGAGAGTVVFVVGLIGTVLLAGTLDRAILVGNQVALKVAPTPSSPEAGRLDAAQSVRIIETFGDYFRVRLPNGQEGFLPARQVEPILPR